MTIPNRFTYQNLNPLSPLRYENVIFKICEFNGNSYKSQVFFMATPIICSISFNYPFWLNLNYIIYFGINGY